MAECISGALESLRSGGVPAAVGSILTDASERVEGLRGAYADRDGLWLEKRLETSFEGLRSSSPGLPDDDVNS